MTHQDPKSVVGPLRSSALAHLPNDFHAMDGAAQINAILDLPAPRAFVESLSPDSFFMLVQHIGPNDSLELLELATLEQRRALIDIGAWRDTSMDAHALDEWLDRIAMTGPERVLETIGELDPEMIVAYLLGCAEWVFDRTEEREIEQYEQNWDLLWSPDRDFVLVLDRSGDDDEVMARARRMLELLYRSDQAAARSLLFAAKTGLRLEQEELAYQFRRGRMADLGFPDRAEAVSLFAPIRVDALAAQLAEQIPPRVHPVGERLSWGLARVEPDRAFLSRCLAELDEASHERFAHEFALCVNRAVVATTGARLGDVGRVIEGGRAVHGTMSLGLEVLVARGAADSELEKADRDGPSLKEGVAVLKRAWLLQLHQVGHAAAVERAIRGRRLAKRGGGLFDEVTERTLEALDQRPRPLFATDEGRVVPFDNLRQLTAVDQRLARGELLCDVFESAFGFTRERFVAHAFAGVSEDDKGFVTFSTLARTALAWAAIGEQPSFEPLSAEQLEGLLPALGALRKTAEGLAPDGVDGAAALLTAEAETLGAALADLPTGERPDPRFFSGVLLVKGG